MLHRATTDFFVYPDNEDEAVPLCIHGGDVLDDRDKKFAPIIKRFPGNFTPADK